jgi:hypothetical protein
MSKTTHRPKVLLAIFTLLAGILACTALLRAQSPSVAPAPAADGAASSGAPADPAFVARATDSLLHARALVDKFFEQTSNVVCTEDVSQTMVGKNAKAMYREESRFDYQMQANSRSGSLKLAESRDVRKVAFRDPSKTLLITNGFASMLLIVHQNYEASYTFEPIAEEEIDGRMLVKIHFKPVAGASSPAAIQLRDRNYPLPLTGDIWIDRESGAVVKLVSSLESNMDDLGLHNLRSEIHYSVVQFHDPEEAYWMPASAVIDVETPKQHWRNVHRFTDYRRFRATIQVEFGDGKP